jgi:hypothetical protein
MAGRFEAAIGYVEEMAIAIRDGRDEVPFGLGGVGRATITAGSSR